MKAKLLVSAARSALCVLFIPFVALADAVQVGITVDKNAREGLLGAPGRFIVSRPAADTAGALEVAYTAGGTAVSGVNYVPLSGTVVIADGEASAVIEVFPKIVSQGDHTLTVTLTDGGYAVDQTAASATMTIAETVFAKEISFKTSGYAGSAPLTNFPVLVKLSTSVTGFSYDDFLCPNGGDLRFALPDGTVLAHEIEAWNTDGVSLVWVRVPELTANTEFKAYYGSAIADVGSPTQVWSDNYVGVWHLDTVALGATPDATGHGLTATNRYPTAEYDEDIVETDGQIGGSVLNGRKNSWQGKSADGFVTPSYTNLFNSLAYTFSGWFNYRDSGGNSGDKRLLSTKMSWNSDYGVELETSSAGENELTITSIGGDRKRFSADRYGDAGWRKFTAVFNDKYIAFYTNGVFSGEANANKSQIHSDAGFAIGNNAALTSQGTLGSIDEVRFAMFDEGADWVKAEYDTEANDAFLSNTGAVAVEDPTLVTFTGDPVVVRQGDEFVMSVGTIGETCGAKIYAIYGPTYPFAHTNLIATVPASASTASGALTAALAGEKCCFGVLSVSDAYGHTCERLGEGCFFNGQIGVALGASASEGNPGVSGRFVISRPSTMCADDLPVTYTIGGSAEPGKHYQAIASTAVIPAGEASVAIDIWPLLRTRGSHTITLTLGGENYLIDPSASSATMTISAIKVKKQIDFRTSGYVGASTLTNFPVLVRLSESVTGFDYDDFEQPNGGDLRFVLPNGQALEHEIQSWNEEGVSLVWVRIPELTAATEFKAYYGSDTADDHESGRTCSDKYFGVWHLDTVTDGATPDSTGHGLTATNRYPTIDASVMETDGVLGGSVFNNNNYTSAGARGFVTPSYTNICNSLAYTFSGWFNYRTYNGAGTQHRLLSTKTAWNSATGVEFETSSSSATTLTITGINGSGNRVHPVGTRDASDGAWRKFTAVFNDKNVEFYTNGVWASSHTMGASLVHGDPGFAIGNNAALGETGVQGSIDEVRFASFDESADWVKAEYDTETSDSFVVNGGVYDNRIPGFAIIVR